MNKKDASIGNILLLQKHSFIFIGKSNKSLLSATSILYRSPVAYNTTASLDKLFCTNYVDFGKCHDRFGQFSWSKKDSKYLDIKPKVFKKDDNGKFRLVQNFTRGEAYFSQFTQLSNQLDIAAENFAIEENLSPVLIPTHFKDVAEQLKLAHKVIDVVDRANRKIYVTLLLYSVDKPEFLCSGPTFERKN